MSGIQAFGAPRVPELTQRSERAPREDVRAPRLRAPAWLAPAAGALAGLGAGVAGALALQRLAGRGGSPLLAALAGVGAIGGAAATIALRRAARMTDTSGSGGPTGPPAGATLAERFPEAGIPEVIVGTTIDKDAWALASGTPAERAEFLMAHAKATGANTVRLGAYWNQMQPREDAPVDFTIVDALLDAADRHGIKVIMSVGAKAPSWPEMYAPDWAKPDDVGVDYSRDEQFQARSRAFVETVAEHLAGRDEIAIWQVENEPLERFWDMPYLRAEQVADEAAILRSSDGGRRPVMINVWAQSEGPVFQNDLESAFEIADVVGIDSYTHTPRPDAVHDRSVYMPRQIMRMSRETGIPVMVAELQADDWNDSNGDHYGTSAQKITDLTHQLHDSGYQDVLFWRQRMNLLRERQGDPSLTNAERELSRWLVEEGREQAAAAR